MSHSCPLSPPRDRTGSQPSDPCRNFNQRTACRRTPCPYPHHCSVPNCKESHPATLHPTQSLQRRTITNAAESAKGLKAYSPINVDLLECYLEGHPDSGFVSSLCVGLREGFRISYLGPRTHTFYPNLRSANQHPDIL